MSNEYGWMIDSLRHAARRPGMWGIDGSYEQFCIFVTGSDLELIAEFHGATSPPVG